MMVDMNIAQPPISTASSRRWTRQTFEFSIFSMKNCIIKRQVKQYNDVIMDSMTSQITSLTIVYSAVYSGADQRKHQSSASLAFVRWIHRGLVNSPHKWQVTRKMFPFDEDIMSDGAASLPPPGIGLEGLRMGDTGDSHCDSRRCNDFE